MTGFLRLELGRSLRDLRYVVLAIAVPVGFYLLFAGIFTGRGTTVGQLPAQVEIMVAMATFGAMCGALSATAPRLARDRESGWLRALEVTPLTVGRVLAARIVAGVTVALPAIVAVAVTAVLAHHVRLDAWQWAAGLGLRGHLPLMGACCAATLESRHGRLFQPGVPKLGHAPPGTWGSVRARPESGWYRRRPEEPPPWVGGGSLLVAVYLRRWRKISASRSRCS